MNQELVLAKCRVDFPQLTQRVRGKPCVYLDSAATALKPWPVIERVGHLLTYQVSNVHRGAHYWADQATTHFENARQLVATFLGAQDSSEIIFTRGTTESINLVAESWGLSNLKKGDVILLTQMEHHSNIVPWQLVAERTGALIRVVPVSSRGELAIGELEAILKTQPVKMVSVVHASNALGTINDVSMIIKLAHAHGALVLVDGAQYVANHQVNVTHLDADFYVFSGHKLFAPYGIGVCYGKKSHLEKMPPYQGGGSMIHEVTFEKTTYHDIPHKFEAGTPNVEGAVGLGAAIEYIQKLGWDQIARHERALLLSASERLSAIEGVRLIGTAPRKVPVVSFLIEGQHPSDVGQILDQANVAVRAGHHCTQPLMKSLGVIGTVRASFSVYNNFSDIDQLVLAVQKAKELLS